MVFARNADDNLASLVKQLDKLVADNKGKRMKAVVHLIGDDKTQLEETAKSFSGKLDLKQVPMTVPTEYENGPANWGLNAQADLTVFMYKGKKVTSSHAYAGDDVSADAVKAIVADVPSKLLN